MRIGHGTNDYEAVILQSTFKLWCGWLSNAVRVSTECEFFVYRSHDLGDDINCGFEGAGVMLQ